MAPVGHSLSQPRRKYSVCNQICHEVTSHSCTSLHHPAAGQDRRRADRFSPNCLAGFFTGAFRSLRASRPPLRRLPEPRRPDRSSLGRSPSAFVSWTCSGLLSRFPSCSRAQGAGAPCPTCRSSRTRLALAAAGVPRTVRPNRFHFRRVTPADTSPVNSIPRRHRQQIRFAAAVKPYRDGFLKQVHVLDIPLPSLVMTIAPCLACARSRPHKRLARISDSTSGGRTCRIFWSGSWTGSAFWPS